MSPYRAALSCLKPQVGVPEPVRNRKVAAAIRAGYSAKGAGETGSKLLRNPKVAAALAGQKSQQLEKAKLSAARILEELRRLGRLAATTALAPVAILQSGLAGGAANNCHVAATPRPPKSLGAANNCHVAATAAPRYCHLNGQYRGWQFGTNPTPAGAAR